jgi:hypothetical protein
MRGLLISGVVLAVCAAAAGQGARRATVWRASLHGAPHPEAPASGRLRGEPFSVEDAELSHGVLTLREGKQLHAGRQVLIFTFEHDRPLDGRLVSVTRKRGFGSPHVHLAARKDWKNGSRQSAVFVDDYAMRLQFGKRVGNRLPGRIYLCLPDPERSYVEGTFAALLK